MAARPSVPRGAPAPSSVVGGAARQPSSHELGGGGGRASRARAGALPRAWPVCGLGLGLELGGGAWELQLAPADRGGTGPRRGAPLRSSTGLAIKQGRGRGRSRPPAPRSTAPPPAGFGPSPSPRHHVPCTTPPQPVLVHVVADTMEVRLAPVAVPRAAPRPPNCSGRLPWRRSSTAPTPAPGARSRASGRRPPRRPRTAPRPPSCSGEMHRRREEIHF
ncbi:hypothetical protein PVAP13_9NG606714 [Panicum virgatum]|uniref:Uncharacterized protein n=1 Tax=Panicum virgatum TaxID=38727 RepID=A0A8T0MZS6_PANVG|nr:hypothetical protein PVAP13_9NG606714 [Panicum virgatum]